VEVVRIDDGMFRQIAQIQIAIKSADGVSMRVVKKELSASGNMFAIYAIFMTPYESVAEFGYDRVRRVAFIP
jgi:hypothetical protein